MAGCPTVSNHYLKSSTNINLTSVRSIGIPLVAISHTLASNQWNTFENDISKHLFKSSRCKWVNANNVAIATIRLWFWCRTVCVKCSSTNRLPAQSAPGTAAGMQVSPPHDDVIKWKHFSRYWPFVRGIHRSRWIPRTKASDAELWCFLWSAPE